MRLELLSERLVLGVVQRARSVQDVLVVAIRQLTGKLLRGTDCAADRVARTTKRVLGALHDTLPAAKVRRLRQRRRLWRRLLFRGVEVASPEPIQLGANRVSKRAPRLAELVEH